MKAIKTIYITTLLAIFFSAAIPSASAAAEKHKEQTISFNFVDVEIPTLIKFISEMTGNNFIFDERIKGNVTIIAPTELSVEESFTLFTSILGLKGYTIIPSGKKTYKIMPSSLAKQSGEIATGETIPVNEGYITKLLPINNIKVDEALEFLRPLVSKDGHISAFGPGNMLLVVDSALNIEKIASILNEIDHPPTHEEPTKINVYPLENADATELANVLQGIVNSAKALKQTDAKGQVTPLPVAIAKISVTPDKATNSLIIIASPSDFQNLVQVISLLDNQRKQVFVEAMIIEASIDKLKELGTKWRAMARDNGDPVAIGGFGNMDTSTLLSLISGLAGFSAGGLGNFMSIPLTNVSADGSVIKSNLTVPGFSVLFAMSDFQDAVNILSTPQILTSDNEEAEIVVGENVPFISKRERDMTTAGTVLNSIERKDVGITLRITPQITEGDYVKLNLYQEISAVKDASDAILIAVGPTTTKRSTKTSVIVKDGQTVVIGGLMQDKEEERITKVPLLGDIPALGLLFKFKTVSKNKTNLLVFLTPHIVKESSQLTKITRDKQTSFAMRENQRVEGELMVKFKDDIPAGRAEEIISGEGASVIKHIKEINVYHIKLRPEQTVDDAVKKFTSFPEILYAEPNFRIRIEEVPALQKPETDRPENILENPGNSSRNNIPARTFSSLKRYSMSIQSKS
ncbi:MAG: ral secretion pathway protein [Nitrospirae bacterium]|nr:ral secretion pathway protein [Nitrospirota bacterium]